MKIHDELKALKCNVCLKVFTCQSRLRVHYRNYTGEKLFSCHICDKKYFSRSSLNQHIKVRDKLKEKN